MRPQERRVFGTTIPGAFCRRNLLRRRRRAFGTSGRHCRRASNSWLRGARVATLSVGGGKSSRRDSERDHPSSAMSRGVVRGPRWARALRGTNEGGARLLGCTTIAHRCGSRGSHPFARSRRMGNVGCARSSAWATVKCWSCGSRPLREGPELVAWPRFSRGWPARSPSGFPRCVAVVGGFASSARTSPNGKERPDSPTPTQETRSRTTCSSHSGIAVASRCESADPSRRRRLRHRGHDVLVRLGATSAGLSCRLRAIELHRRIARLRESPKRCPLLRWPPRTTACARAHRGRHSYSSGRWENVRGDSTRRAVCAGASSIVKAFERDKPCSLDGSNPAPPAPPPRSPSPDAPSWRRDGVSQLRFGSKLTSWSRSSLVA